MPITFLTDHLRASARAHGELKDQIKSAFGLDDDDQTLADTLEGETDFRELCAKALREVKAREAMAEGLATLIKEMQARKARMDHSVDCIRSIVASAMLDAHESKITQPDMTVSVRMGKPKLSIDAGRIPDRFKMTVTNMVPNKDAIQEAVDRGEVPEGVSIASPQPIITVRTK